MRRVTSIADYGEHEAIGEVRSSEEVEPDSRLPTRTDNEENGGG